MSPPAPLRACEAADLGDDTCSRCGRSRLRRTASAATSCSTHRLALVTARPSSRRRPIDAGERRRCDVARALAPAIADAPRRRGRSCSVASSARAIVRRGPGRRAAGGDPCGWRLGRRRGRAGRMCTVGCRSTAFSSIRLVRSVESSADSHPPLDYCSRMPFARAGRRDLAFRRAVGGRSRSAALALFVAWMRRPSAGPDDRHGACFAFSSASRSRTAARRGCTRCSSSSASSRRDDRRVVVRRAAALARLGDGGHRVRRALRPRLRRAPRDRSLRCWPASAPTGRVAMAARRRGRRHRHGPSSGRCRSSPRLGVHHPSWIPVTTVDGALEAVAGHVTYTDGAKYLVLARGRGRRGVPGPPRTPAVRRVGRLRCRPVRARRGRRCGHPVLPRPHRDRGGVGADPRGRVPGRRRGAALAGARAPSRSPRRARMPAGHARPCSAARGSTTSRSSDCAPRRARATPSPSRRRGTARSPIGASRCARSSDRRVPPRCGSRTPTPTGSGAPPRPGGSGSSSTDPRRPSLEGYRRCAPPGATGKPSCCCLEAPRE